jgi:hypothetical protein
MTRYQEWTRRCLLGQLGAGVELWADVSAHPAAGRLEALAKARRRSIDSDDIADYITRSLLLDVIHAAGGIEYTVEKLVAALDVVQRQADEYYSSTPQAQGKGLWGPERWDVSFEVSNLVVWARTLLERLESKIDEGGNKVKVGLLPALAEGDLKNEVSRFRDELDRWVRAERHLAGFTLHVGRLHGGTPWLQVGPDGRVRFLLPDRPRRRVWSWEEFTHRENRDARTVAGDLLGRVERFMDRLLTSFEQHVPERFRR